MRQYEGQLERTYPTMATEPERTNELHRHYLEVLNRLELQLQRLRQAVHEGHAPEGTDLNGVAIQVASVSRQLARASALRRQSAEIADQMADTADAYASFLENTASRDRSPSRGRIARTERVLAQIERRNAAKMRESESTPGPLTLERLPSLFVENPPES